MLLSLCWFLIVLLAGSAYFCFCLHDCVCVVWLICLSTQHVIYLHPTPRRHGEVTDDPDQLRDLNPQFWPSIGGFTGSHVSVNANSYPLMKNPSPGDNKFITFEKLLFWSIFYTLIHILHIKLMSLTYRIEIFGLWIQCECSHYYKMKSNINN